ncbi:MAG: VCBS repeat-containing protein [Gammaproteobacteria bacterium]|nr:VCBS repeat-containing protein [Gammaproteobacteria bacterium]
MTNPIDRIARLPSRRYAWLLAALPALASCGGDGCWNCYGPPPPAPEVAQGLVAGNFAGNGAPSLIATSTVLASPGPNPGNLKIYLSSGAGAYAAPVLAADGQSPLYLASADLDGNGLPDVVSASYADGQLAVFLNQKQLPGTFAAPVLLASPGASQVAIGDMNGDGLPDLVSADFNVSLFLQTAPGTFAAPVALYPGGANWVAVGDLNGDGVADVALTDAVGVKVLMHTGAASASTYAAPVSVFTQTPNANVAGANLIAIADVNGDGANDLVITDPGPTGCTAPTVNVLLQNPAQPGTFLAPAVYPLGVCNPAESILVADVNGDGRPDIVIGGDNGVTVLLQDPANPGKFLAAASYAAPEAHQIALADVNGDGYVDIVVANGPPQAAVNGVVPNDPGVLLQNSGSPGTFGTLKPLP